MHSNRHSSKNEKREIILYHGTTVYTDDRGRKLNRFGKPFDIEEKGIKPPKGFRVDTTPAFWQALFYTPSDDSQKSRLGQRETVVYEIKPKGLPAKVLREYNSRSREGPDGLLYTSNISGMKKIPREWITGKYTVIDDKEAFQGAMKNTDLKNVKGLVYQPLPIHKRKY